MINFYRKKRQNLLSEGKSRKHALPTGRYLKYAVGEIILVVIGILIALQINNWNEKYKASIQEQEYYCLLLQNIEQDKEQVLKLNALTQKRIEASIEAIREMQKEKPESVLFAKNWFPAFSQTISTFRPNDATFSDIKSSGNLKLLKDKSITTALNEYFKNVSGYSEAILSNTDALKSKLNNLESWFEAGFYQVYFEENNKYFPEDIIYSVRTDLPKYISETYKPKFYDLALFLGTNNQRRSILLQSIENEVDMIKEILESKCKLSK